MQSRELQIKKAIFQLEKPIPAGNLISSYKDFLKHRDLLHFYEFNIDVLESLVNLTHTLWFTEKRISRQSLVQTTRRYAALHQSPILYSKESTNKLFDLFKMIIVENGVKGHKLAIEAIEYSINTLLKNVCLKEEQLAYLIGNLNSSEHVLNRVFRYNQKSIVVTQWIKENYTNDLYRTRRAELIGWLLDENTQFVVDKQTLIDDFEYCNRVDLRSLHNYEGERKEEFLRRRNLGGQIDAIEPLSLNMYLEEDRQPTKVPEPSFLKRFYPTHRTNMSNHYRLIVPEMDALRDDFYANIDKCTSVTMMWAVYYSHLNLEEKKSLLIKHYIPSAYFTFFRIAKKLKNTDLLQWILEHES